MYKIVSDKYESAAFLSCIVKICCAGLCEAHPRALHTAAEHAYSAASLTTGNLGQIVYESLAPAKANAGEERRAATECTGPSCRLLCAGTFSIWQHAVFFNNNICILALSCLPAQSFMNAAVQNRHTSGQPRAGIWTCESCEPTTCSVPQRQARRHTLRFLKHGNTVKPLKAVFGVNGSGVVEKPASLYRLIQELCRSDLSNSIRPFPEAVQICPVPNPSRLIPA